MPVSKRNKQIELAKTKRRGLDGKKQLVREIQQCCNNFEHLFIFTVNDMRNSKMKDVRQEWKHSRFFIGKNKVMTIALGRTPEEEYKPSLHKISRNLAGERGLLFTDKPIDEVMQWFNSYSEGDFARSGNKATEDVTLLEGPLLQFPHSLESYLRQLGLPTTLKKGVIHLVKDFVVCKEGDILSPETARILKLLGYQMAEFQLQIECVWSQDGSFQDLKPRSNDISEEIPQPPKKKRRKVSKSPSDVENIMPEDDFNKSSKFSAEVSDSNNIEDMDISENYSEDDQVPKLIEDILPVVSEQDQSVQDLSCAVNTINEQKMVVVEAEDIASEIQVNVSLVKERSDNIDYENNYSRKVEDSDRKQESEIDEETSGKKLVEMADSQVMTSEESLAVERSLSLCNEETIVDRIEKETVNRNEGAAIDKDQDDGETVKDQDSEETVNKDQKEEETVNKDQDEEETVDNDQGVEKTLNENQDEEESVDKNQDEEETVDIDQDEEETVDIDQDEEKTIDIDQDEEKTIDIDQDEEETIDREAIVSVTETKLEAQRDSPKKFSPKLTRARAKATNTRVKTPDEKLLTASARKSIKRKA